jgi:hypothetical protein
VVYSTNVDDGTIVATDAVAGTRVAEIALGGGIRSRVTPTVVNGSVYVSSFGGLLPFGLP